MYTYSTSDVLDWTMAIKLLARVVLSKSVRSKISLKGDLRTWKTTI